jgi:hypothetical protein
VDGAAEEFEKCFVPELDKMRAAKAKREAAAEAARQKVCRGRISSYGFKSVDASCGSVLLGVSASAECGTHAAAQYWWQPLRSGEVLVRLLRRASGCLTALLLAACGPAVLPRSKQHHTLHCTTKHCFEQTILNGRLWHPSCWHQSCGPMSGMHASWIHGCWGHLCWRECWCLHGPYP